jgi:hypothetical protein
MMPTLNSALHQKWLSEKWLYSNKVGAYTLFDPITGLVIQLEPIEELSSDLPRGWWEG